MKRVFLAMAVAFAFTACDNSATSGTTSKGDSLKTVAKDSITMAAKTAKDSLTTVAKTAKDSVNTAAKTAKDSVNAAPVAKDHMKKAHN